MQDARLLKNRLYDQFERIGKALASRRRLELLDVLAQGPRTVEELAGQTSMSVANASQHLQVLKKARLVETRQEGNHVFYGLADERVFAMMQGLRDLAQARLAEVDQIARDYFGNRDDLAPIGMKELSDLMRAGDVVVLDVRPLEEYENGHITGARSLPVDELEERISELPPETDIVAYCRGPYCVFALEAVERLRKHGRWARRLDLGFPDWRAAGFPYETGAVAKDSLSRLTTPTTRSEAASK